MMQIRPYQGTDEDDLRAVWNASMIHDRVSSRLFQRKVLLDHNFQAGNLPVAIIDGKLVGFALALTRVVPFYENGLEPEHAWIMAFGVQPDYRRRGVGRALFEYVIERLRGQSRRWLDISPYEPNYFAPGVDIDAYPAAVEFLQNEFGFREVDHAISMGIDLSNFYVPPEIVELERGLKAEHHISIQPLESTDLPDALPFNRDQFGGGWYDYIHTSLLEGFGAANSMVGVLVARQNETVIGFCHQRQERFGPFGVHPDMRGLGIGRALLYRCLEMMSARHLYYAYFMWTEDNAARLYSRVGFAKRREFTILRKEL